MKTPASIKLGSMSHKSDRGFKISWISCNRLKITLSVGVLGAVGTVLVLKGKRYLGLNFYHQDIFPSRFWAVPGLQNLGNNCFLNVILQALASCSSFRKYLGEMVEEYGPSSVEEADENIPLISSLTSLMEELCTIRHTRTVLSPRKFMLAMDHYIPNFNLTRQQDADEAFSHLLSSLREEISEHCVPNKSCLVDLPALRNDRILTTKISEEESKWQRWNRMFLKPFDGILGSILICRSCSFQISLDFQLFQSLHLSPPILADPTIMAGCTLEDCLKKFFVSERIENYRCSKCWHKAAIEYLSAFAEDKTDIENLHLCNKDNSCGCKTLSSLEAFPWSNRFSRAFKQLSIARSPKLQKAPFQRQMYRLVSVVVHYGTSGNGHYMVYRKVTARLGDKDPVALLESAIDQWFCISDSDVHSVSAKEVFDANASMLFYEKIDNS